MATDKPTATATDDELLEALRLTWSQISMDAVSASGGHMSGKAAREMVPDYLSAYGHLKDVEARRLAAAFLARGWDDQERLLKIALPARRYVL